MKQSINEKTLRLIAIGSAIISIIGICMAMVQFFDVEPWMIAIGITFISLYSLLVTLFILRVRRKSIEKKNLINKAKYSEMREYLERNINIQQMKMARTNDSWKEMYHLPLSAQTKQSENENSQNQLSYTNSFIDAKDLQTEENLIFMLTSFHSDYESIYYITQEVCLDLGFRLLRGDEEYVSTDLLTYTISNIAKAKLIIANIEGRNPNVFYELGIAHALGKKTILIAQAFENAPFDIRNFRIILYGNSGEYRKNLKNTIIDALDK